MTTFPEWFEGNMEKSFVLIFSICLAAVFSIQFVYGIQCYQCNSYDDSGCADFFDNSTYAIQACPDEAKYCRKVVQQAFYEGAWHMRYVRQCAREGELDASRPNQDWHCYDKLGTYRVKVKYCHCKVDGCNTASNMKLSKWFTFTPTLLILLTYLYTAITG